MNERIRHGFDRVSPRLAVLLVSSACAIGPKYRRPDRAGPAGIQGGAAGRLEGCAAQRRRASRQVVERVYNDPGLDALEDQVSISNQNVLAAEAQFRAAQSGRARRPGRSISHGDRGAVRHAFRNGRGVGRAAPLHDPDRCDLSGRRLGKHPAQRGRQRRRRAGVGRRTRERPLVVPGGARRRLLPASGTGRRAAAARRHREVVRAVCATDPGPIRRRRRVDGRRGAGSDAAGNSPRAVGRPGQFSGRNSSMRSPC